MDKVIISNAKFVVCHGVHDFEKVNPQPFIISAELYCDLSAAMKSDNVADTVSYGDAYRIIEKTVRENCFDLIERLADEIMKNLFAVLHKVDIIKIKIKKPNAPVKGEFDYMAIEVERKRNEI